MGFFAGGEIGLVEGDENGGEFCHKGIIALDIIFGLFCWII